MVELNPVECGRNALAMATHSSSVKTGYAWATSNALRASIVGRKEIMKQNYDIIETAKKVGEFQVFAGAVVEAGLEEALKDVGPYTVFAPTDQAFAKMPKNKLDDLLKPENKGRLQLLLRNHIVLGKLTASELKTLDETKTSKGEELRIQSGTGLWVNEAKIVSPDLDASNGVIHGIDTVLIPQSYGAAVA